MEFNDGSLGFVPINSGVVLAGTPTAKVAVKVGDDPAVRAVQHDHGGG